MPNYQKIVDQSSLQCSFCIKFKSNSDYFSCAIDHPEFPNLCEHYLSHNVKQIETLEEIEIILAKNHK